MFELLSLAHGLILIIVGWHSYKSIRQRSALGIIMLIFILFDSLGLIVLPYFNWDLPYVSRSVVIPLREISSPYLYLRQILAHWIFLILAWVGLHFERRFMNLAKPTRKVDLSLFTWVFFLTIFLAGLAAYVRFFALGPGLHYVKENQVFYSTPQEAVMARVMMRPVRGEGFFAAMLASYNVFPCLTCLLLLRGDSPNKRLKSFIWVTFFGMLSLAYMLSTFQKAPIATALITYSILFILVTSFTKKISLFAMIVLLGTFISILLYVLNFGLKWADAFASVIGRLILVPGNVESYWFLIYPNSALFEGFSRTITTEMEIIHLVAKNATGDLFSANASFLAVGWSGAGYIGVLIACFFVIMPLFMLDIKFRDYPDKLRLASMLFNGVAAVMLVSGSVADFYLKGGITPWLLIFALALGKRRIPPVRKI